MDCFIVENDMLVSCYLVLINIEKNNLLCNDYKKWKVDPYKRI